MLVQIAREAGRRAGDTDRDYQADQQAMSASVAPLRSRMYAPLLIPGLLQIAAYALAVFARSFRTHRLKRSSTA